MIQDIPLGLFKGKVYDRPNQNRNQQLCHMFFTRHGGISSQIKNGALTDEIRSSARYRIKANQLYTTTI